MRLLKTEEALGGLLQIHHMEGGVTYYAIGNYLMDEGMFRFQVTVWIGAAILAIAVAKIVFLELWFQDGLLRFWQAALVWVIASLAVLFLLNMPYRLATWWGVGHDAAIGAALAIWGLIVAWILHRSSQAGKRR